MYVLSHDVNKTEFSILFYQWRWRTRNSNLRLVYITVGVGTPTVFVYLTSTCKHIKNVINIFL